MATAPFTPFPIGGVVHTVGEGDSLLMPAGVPHAVRPLGGFKMLLIMIRGEGQTQN